eukprot:768431-Hanusia_phi.AAC.10
MSSLLVLSGIGSSNCHSDQLHVPHLAPNRLVKPSRPQKSIIEHAHVTYTTCGTSPRSYALDTYLLAQHVLLPR